MKLWTVHPMYLDSGRLLMEHRSVHGILTAITSDVNTKIKKYYNYGGYLVYRHYALVEEMRIRNNSHTSYVDKLYFHIPERRRRLDFRITENDIRSDAVTLMSRQKRENKSGGEGRSRLDGTLPREWLNIVEQLPVKGLPKDIFLI